MRYFLCVDRAFPIDLQSPRHLSLSPSLSQIHSQTAPLSLSPAQWNNQYAQTHTHIRTHTHSHNTVLGDWAGANRSSLWETLLPTSGHEGGRWPRDSLKDGRGVKPSSYTSTLYVMENDWRGKKMRKKKKKWRGCWAASSSNPLKNDADAGREGDISIMIQPIKKSNFSLQYGVQTRPLGAYGPYWMAKSTSLEILIEPAMLSTPLSCNQWHIEQKK